jgi:hypothetical protein
VLQSVWGSARDPDLPGMWCKPHPNRAVLQPVWQADRLRQTYGLVRFSCGVLQANAAFLPLMMEIILRDVSGKQRGFADESR